MKARVPIAGTVGKSISFDPRAGARAEAAVAALAAQISAGFGGNIRHSALQGLQIGDDHPQYTGNAFPETITGQWNFATIPRIQGETLAEYIEDVVGGSFFDFLQDTTSVVWTYFDTAQHLEANVPPEFVQDTVGAMLVDTSTVAFTYDDPAGTILAVVPGAALTNTDDTNVTLTLGGTPATALARAASLTLGWTGQLAVSRGGSGAGTLTGYLKGNGTAAFTAVSTVPYSDISGTPTIPAGANPSASVGLAAVNGSATSFMRSDGAPALSQAIAPTWTGNHTFTPASGNTIFHAGNVRLDLDNLRIQLGASQDFEFYHDGTDSLIVNNTGSTRFFTGPNGLNTYRAGGNPFFGFFASDNTTRNGYLQWVDSGNVNIANETAGGSIALITSAGANFLSGTARTSTLLPLNLKNYTVSTLPTGVRGDTAYVTDALAPTFGATVVGGGAVVIPVFYNGTNWVSH